MRTRVDPLENVSEETDKLRQLYCAIISQALEDATRGVYTTLHEWQAARNWFQRGGKDFREVCSLAGLDPDQIRERAIILIADTDANNPSKHLAASLEPRQRTPMQFFTHDGKSQTIGGWARDLGMEEWNLRQRMKKMSLAEVIERLANGENLVGRRAHPAVAHTGKSIGEWAREIGVDRSVVQTWLRKGDTIEEIVRRFTNGEARPRRPRTSKPKQQALEAAE